MGRIASGGPSGIASRLDKKDLWAELFEAPCTPYEYKLYGKDKVLVRLGSEYMEAHGLSIPGTLHDDVQTVLVLQSNLRGVNRGQQVMICHDGFGRIYKFQGSPHYYEVVGADSVLGVVEGLGVEE